MKAMIFAIATTMITASVFAETDVKNMTKEERKARREEAMQKRFGGIVIDRTNQRGSFLYVNAQTTVADTVFASEVAQVGELMKIDARVVPTSENVTLANISELQSKLKANAAVFIVSNDEYPPLLISPERNWGIINVKALLAGTTDADKIKKRMACEVWRSFAFMTQGYSPDVRSAMQEIKDVKEFDDFAGVQFGPETMMSAPRHLNAIGIYPYEVTTYRALCRLGKAQSPTNEFQQAIWNEFHSIPTKPITIEPEKKPVTK